MADENINNTTPIDTPPIDSMETFIESFNDKAQQKAFRDCLNESGEFDREKIRDLAGRYLSERRSLSKITEMPDDVAKFKENFTPDERFAPLFDETNDGGKKIREMFDKLDVICMEQKIGETKNKALKQFLLNTFADNNIIDARTPDEREAESQKQAENQKEILENALGKNTDLDKVNAIIDQFVDDEADGDDTVKAVFDAIKSSAKGKLILYSLRNRIYGKPVPVIKTEIGQTKKSLEKEYDNPNTTRERRKEIAEKLNEIEGLE